MIRSALAALLIWAILLVLAYEVGGWIAPRPTLAAVISTCAAAPPQPERVKL